MTQHTIITDKVAALEAKFDFPGGSVRWLFGELLEIIHETTFKGSTTDALLGLRYSLGPEAAWHFFGIIYDSLRESDTELTSDQRSLWLETMRRLDFDNEMKDYGTRILDRWSAEMTDELEKQ
jgi:hypothetical protein